MQRNTLRPKMRGEGMALGAFVKNHSPWVVEVLGLLGFDCVVLDAEHGPLGPAECESLVRAAEAVGIAALIRVPSVDHAVLLPFVETGACGIMVPHVRSAAEARTASDGVRYPPLGRRGVSRCRAAGFGAVGTLREHLERTNAEMMIIGIVEDQEGLANVEAIAAEPGLDALLTGVVDMSVALGFPGEYDRPELAESSARIVRAARAAGKPVGALALSPDDAASLARQGYDLVLMASEDFFGKAMRALRAGVLEAARQR